MKIAQHLPQFTHTTGQLIVADHYHCQWYELRHRHIFKKGGFTFQKPHYSDREDYGRRAGGIVFETGALFEKRHREAVQEFLKRFKAAWHDQFKDLRPDITYLFVPADLVAPLERILTATGRRVITRAGNFTKEHPFTLLGRIQAHTAVPPVYLTFAERRWMAAAHYS